MAEAVATRMAEFTAVPGAPVRNFTMIEPVRNARSLRVPSLRIIRARTPRLPRVLGSIGRSCSRKPRSMPGNPVLCTTLRAAGRPICPRPGSTRSVAQASSVRPARAHRIELCGLIAKKSCRPRQLARLCYRDIERRPAAVARGEFRAGRQSGRARRCQTLAG